MAGVAVVGYGVVGSGTVRLLVENRELILRKSGLDAEVRHIVDIRDFPGDPYADRITPDFQTVLDDPEVSVVVETIGGAGIALEFTRQALASGRSVVTSNKELVARHGPELTALATENDVRYLFEASVGGGIPIIQPIRQSLASNRITRVSGILNGTTNYILTRMDEEDISFEEALREAQENGFAEQNPQADIDGVDACRKIAILSTLSFEGYVSCDDIHTEGIRNLDAAAVKLAASAGAKVKLFADARRADDGTLRVSVMPTAISGQMPATVADGVNNAIVVESDALGRSMYYGPGAGAMPTASAVVSDVLECIAAAAGKQGAEPGAGVWTASNEKNMMPFAAHPVCILLDAGSRTARTALSERLLTKGVSSSHVPGTECALLCGADGNLSEGQWSALIAEGTVSGRVWIRYAAD